MEFKDNKKNNLYFKNNFEDKRTSSDKKFKDFLLKKFFIFFIFFLFFKG